MVMGLLVWVVGFIEIGVKIVLLLIEFIFYFIMNVF